MRAELKDRVYQFVMYLIAAFLLITNLAACGKPPTLPHPAPPVVLTQATCTDKVFGIWFTGVGNEIPGDEDCDDAWAAAAAGSDHCIQWHTYFAIDGLTLVPPRCLSRVVKDTIYQSREY